MSLVATKKITPLFGGIRICARIKTLKLRLTVIQTLVMLVTTSLRGYFGMTFWVQRSTLVVVH